MTRIKSVFHFLIRSANPQVGGMEHSIVRVAGHLAQMPGAIVRIYTLSDDEKTAPDISVKNIQIVYLKNWKFFLTRPLKGGSGGSERNAEISQIEFLAYKSAVKAAIEFRPRCRHAVLSFFISQTGFMAQQVADALQIPHIASIRGSDFSRDMRNAGGLSAITHVVRRADWLVATNQEQAESIAYIFGRRSRITTILNSIALPKGALCWKPTRRIHARLFSDCGYSFKKGTHVLLRAAADLAKEGLPFTLTVIGNVERDAADFWQAERKAYSREFPRAYVFEEWMPPDKIARLMRQADIYCSATLGEGCSNARLKALVWGMPIVTTRCGEMIDLALKAGHVRLAEPGDLEGYKSALRESVVETLRTGIQVRPEPVRRWRARCHPRLEREAWQKVARQVMRAR